MCKVCDSVKCVSIIKENLLFYVLIVLLCMYYQFCSSYYFIFNFDLVLNIKLLFGLNHYSTDNLLIACFIVGMLKLNISRKYFCLTIARQYLVCNV